jgi:hypothetical protein
VGDDDIRAVLEDALHAYCTLTEGDWLQVERGGKQHDVQVRRSEHWGALLARTGLAAGCEQPLCAGLGPRS